MFFAVMRELESEGEILKNLLSIPEEEITDAIRMMIEHEINGYDYPERYDPWDNMTWMNND